MAISMSLPYQRLRNLAIRLDHAESTEKTLQRLDRIRVPIRSALGSGSVMSYNRQVVTTNSELSIEFGWSFSSQRLLEAVVKDCVAATGEDIRVLVGGNCDSVLLHYNDLFNRAWHGAAYGEEECVFINRKIVQTQDRFLTAFLNHNIYQQHRILRNSAYRYWYFVQRRHSAELLAQAYKYYLQAIHEVSHIDQLPREILEQDIGCHFLSFPELFLELTSWCVLKGEVVE